MFIQSQNLPGQVSTRVCSSSLESPPVFGTLTIVWDWHANNQHRFTLMHRQRNQQKSGDAKGEIKAFPGQCCPVLSCVIQVYCRSLLFHPGWDSLGVAARTTRNTVCFGWRFEPIPQDSQQWIIIQKRGLQHKSCNAIWQYIRLYYRYAGLYCRRHSE
jgi:hypothetical protein